MHNVTMVISEELDLNVLGLVQEAFHEDCAIAKGRLCLGCGSLERLLQTCLIAHHSHATTTAAVSGLDDNGETIFISEALNLLKGGHCTGGTRDNGNIGPNSQCSCRNLVAEGVNDIGRRSDELQDTSEPISNAQSGKGRISPNLRSSRSSRHCGQIRRFRIRSHNLGSKVSSISPKERKPCLGKRRLLTRVNHLGTMLQSDLDDLVAGQISTDWGVLPALANDVGFVGLCVKDDN